ncbi:hypothetical protein BDI4_200039 [Burkholderia diffusa]|nr:hypothetical protein BDI4_200039 [Burkholderia diffusa]
MRIARRQGVGSLGTRACARDHVELRDRPDASRVTPTQRRAYRCNGERATHTRDPAAAGRIDARLRVHHGGAPRRALPKCVRGGAKNAALG